MQILPKESAVQSPSIASPAQPVLPRSEATVLNLPVNLFAAVMGFAGLALAWRFVHHSLGAPAAIGEAIGGFAVAVFLLIAMAYVVKLIKYPDAVRSEFSHPVVGNFFATIVISVLLISVVIEPYSAVAGQVVWTLGALATLALSFVAVSRLLKGQIDGAHVVPAWFMPSVATLDIPLTGAHMPMAWALEINLLACAIGSAMALVLFALIISRLVHRDPMALAMTPSLMILVAPFAVACLAYSSMVGGMDRFAALLFYFGLFLFFVVAPKVFRPGIPFSAAWWAIGFPIAALVNAALRYAEFRASTPLWVLAIALLVFLSLALVVLTVRTVQMALSGKLFV